MKTWPALLYGMLFLISQLLGVFFGFLGFTAPMDYLRLGQGTSLHYFSLIMLVASALMFFHVWRASLHPALLSLPAYHLLGVLGMQVYAGRLAAALTLGFPVESPAAQLVVIQHPDMLLVVLIHSVFGLVGGAYLMLLVNRDERAGA